jgi:hypothetical protein
VNEPHFISHRIAKERHRAIVDEGHTPERDRNKADRLLLAAACYALEAHLLERHPDAPTPNVPLGWPWAPEHWKPASVDRMREKAGQLALAAVDELGRLLTDTDQTTLALAAGGLLIDDGREHVVIQVLHDVKPSAFEVQYDAEHLFPFFEDENAAGVYGYGHTDRAVFAAAVNDYDDLCNGGELTVHYEPADVTHHWGVAYIPNPAHPDVWRFTWRGITEATPHAFPFTKVDR